MSFKKPFRAVPIKLGHRYRRKAQREVVTVLAMAAAVGLAFGVGSIVAGRPVRSMWNAITEDGATTKAREESVYYSGCDDARRAGAAPIYVGEAGYRPDMDGDGDGIACEPYYH